MHARILTALAAVAAPVAFAAEEAAKETTKHGGSIETLIVLGVVAALGYVFYRAGMIGGGSKEH